MPSGKIFEIPYWFHARAVLRRHRNAEQFLLRGSFPFEMTTLTKTEAPVRLRAKLRVEGHPFMNNEIELRHDGVSYLRAIDGMARHPETEAPPFDEDSFAAMLEWRDNAWPAIYGGRDNLVWILTLATEKLCWTEGFRTIRKRPPDLQTWAEFCDGVRTLEWSHEEGNRRAAMEEIASLVLVDGHLHRRVAPPIAYLSDKGIPHIIHADQIADAGKIGSTARHRIGMTDHVMPISYAPWLTDLSVHPSAAAISAEVDAALETDPRANLAFAVAFAVPDCARWFAHAVEDMTAEGMAAYRTFRELRPAAEARDYDACAATMKAMRAMAEGAPYADGRKNFEAMLRHVSPKLAFLDELVRRSGLELDAADEAALSDMALTDMAM